MTVANVTPPKAVLSKAKIFEICNQKYQLLLWDLLFITIKSCKINNLFHQMLIHLPVSISISNCKAYDRKYGILLSIILFWLVKCLNNQKTKIQIGALFGCISDSLQPLAVHSHQLLCVQPNDSGKCNTAKSCTEYSQFICSVLNNTK